MRTDLPFDARRNITHLFPTPMGSAGVADAERLMPRFEAAVLERERSGHGTAGAAGWQSADDVLDWPEPGFADLKKGFSSALSKVYSAFTGHLKFRISFDMKARAHAVRPGHYDRMRVCPGSHLTGMLFVKVPDCSADPLPLAGQLEFMDPRGPVDMVKTPVFKDSETVAPEQGRILVFPSSLYHCIHPFSVRSELIYITCNAYILKFEPK